MIRTVRDEADIRAVCALARRVWTEHYTPIIGPGQVAHMLEKFQSPAAVADQIRDGVVYARFGPAKAPVGYLAYAREPDRLFLSKLYVDAPARRRGWARRGLEWIRAREPGAVRMELTVNRHNTAALAAYRRLGFRKVGEQVADIGEGYVMDDHVLRREWV